MSSKNLKRTIAAVSAVVMLAGAVMAPLNGANVVSAGEVLGETSFDYKALPWHTCESSPAKQDFKIEDGAFHVTIIKADGADGAKWDLQVRHRNINLKSGHHYKISFRAKASRSGLQLCSKIGNIGGDEEYVELLGQAREMIIKNTDDIKERRKKLKELLDLSFDKLREIYSK